MNVTHWKQLCLAASVAVFAIQGEAATTSYQAESAAISHGIFENLHAGYTGTGYVNYNNEVGSYVEWVVNAPAAGTFRLSFLYANGTTLNRPMDISLNGVSINNSLAFRPTGAWATWKPQGLNVALHVGSNTIRARATTAQGGPNVDRLDVSDQPAPTFDWSKALVDSTMARTPNAANLGSWRYEIALFLHGDYLVYKRTGDDRYLQYMRAWVDSHIDANGNVDVAINSLDNMLGGNLFVLLFQETGQAVYRTAADKIRQRVTSYPRTSDGALWHNTGLSGQLWSDGSFMVAPFLARYGKQFNDNSALDDAANQLILYTNHLKNAATGLPLHAYDETLTGDSPWANATTHQSAEHWCRAVGWNGMAYIEVLENLPNTHPKRAQLITNLKSLLTGVKSFQHAQTGLWYEVVDKGANSENWHETSCSSMHSYVMSRAVQRGYVDSSFKAPAASGRLGVLTKLYRGTDNLTQLTEVVQGTGVGDAAYYFARSQPVNDFHGLGSFLIMNEQFFSAP